MAFSVLVLSISILAALVIPIAKGMLIQARARAVQADLRVFSAAFQAYAAEHGDWPTGDGTPGAVPPGMLKYLRNTNWQRRTSIGGNYAWDPDSLHQGFRIRAAIVIAGVRGYLVSSDRIQLHEIDQGFDDADLATGNFFLGYRNYPVYVLER